MTLRIGGFTLYEVLCMVSRQKVQTEKSKIIKNPSPKK